MGESVLVPHTVCLLRLLANPEVQEGNRGRRGPREDVVDFVLKEAESDQIKHYQHMALMLDHIEERLGKIVRKSLQKELQSIEDMFTLHRMILEALNTLPERLKDPLLDKSNLLDVFFRRAQRDLKTMNFPEIARLFELFVVYRGDSMIEHSQEKLAELVPQSVKERLAHQMKSNLDTVALSTDPFSNELVPVKFEDPIFIEKSRYGPYIKAMEAFHQGNYDEGCSKMHDFFDNNIYLYFENPRQATFQHFEQKKEEYKMAVEHSSLQKVAIGLQSFLLEASSKLLEETLRWAQLNHHETEVQFCLLYKGKMMEKLGEPRLHFTYVEDSLVKALSFSNYTLQVHSSLEHLNLDVLYDLKKLRKDIGQFRNINPSVLINTAFVKLLADPRLRAALNPQPDIYCLRGLMLAQRRDFLHNLGLRKKNKYLDKCNPAAEKSVAPTMLSDFMQLESLFDENVSLFTTKWKEMLSRKRINLQEYQLGFFDAYFQSKFLLRRRDTELISTYIGIMDKIANQFPEPQLLFRLWSLKIEVQLEKGEYERAYISAQFFLKTLENAGYTKELYLKQKLIIARIYLFTGKEIKAFEELNGVISRSKEHSLNDIWVKAKLLQTQIYFKLGFYSKCLSTLHKMSSPLMMASSVDKLEHKMLETKVCLQIIKLKMIAESPTLISRVLLVIKEAIVLAQSLQEIKYWKQLLYIQARMSNQIGEIEIRNKCSLQALRLGEAEKFMNEQGIILYSLDDKIQRLEVNEQFGKLLVHVGRN